MTNEAATGPKRGASKPWWLEHAGIMVSASLFALISLRVLGVAGWDATVALAIVQSGGAANVALASALSSAPAIVSFAVFIWTVRLCADILERRVNYWSLAPALYGLLLVIFLVPTAYLLGACALIALAVGYRALLERRRGAVGRGLRNPYSPAEQRAWLIAMVGSQLLLTSMTTWLPSESISIDGGQHFTGYVVSSDASITTVLRDEGKPTIERIESKMIDRSYCETSTSWLWAPIGSLGSSSLDSCPRSQ